MAKILVKSRDSKSGQVRILFLQQKRYTYYKWGWLYWTALLDIVRISITWMWSNRCSTVNTSAIDCKPVHLLVRASSMSVSLLSMKRLMTWMHGRSIYQHALLVADQFLSYIDCCLGCEARLQPVVYGAAIPNFVAYCQSYLQFSYHASKFNYQWAINLMKDDFDYWLK